MKKSLLLVVVALVLCVSISAKMNPIVTSVPSLMVAPDARAGGMGEVGAATSPDMNSQHWNPSKYAFMDSKGGASFSYVPWLSKIVKDINVFYLSGFAKIHEMHALSASLRFFSMGDVEMTNFDGTYLSTTSPFECAADIAYSIRLAENWSAGVALRYIRVDFGAVENLEPGNAFAADVCASFRMPVNIAGNTGTVGAGINFSNIGTKIGYDDGHEYFLPANMRIGASFECPIDEYNKISLNVDANKLLVPCAPRAENYEGGATGEAYKNAEKEYYSTSSMGGLFKSFNDSPASEEFKEVAWAIGAEYSYNNQFMVRAGYFYEHEDKGNRKYWQFGAGFRLHMFRLDAAYTLATGQTNPLDRTLRFTLTFDSDGLKNLAK